MACHPGFWGDALCNSAFENDELFCTTINIPVELCNRFWLVFLYDNFKLLHPGILLQYFSCIVCILGFVRRKVSVDN